MISIFAKPPFPRTDSETGTYVVRVSSRIRGEEISEYMGTKYNPKERDGICIFLKPRGLDGLIDGDYVDILDEVSLIPKLKERPELKVIAMSLAQYDYLKTIIPNEVFLIHHHHINFERFRRTKNAKIVGGAIGHSKYANQLYKDIKSALARVDIGFVPILSYQTRQDMVGYFKKIDFLVAWNIDAYKDYPHSHPTKIINAGSFGIPTLSQPIIGYKEFPFIAIQDMESLVGEAEELKNTDYYDHWSDMVFDESEHYHISKIAELYKQLK